MQTPVSVLRQVLVPVMMDIYQLLTPAIANHAMPPATTVPSLMIRTNELHVQVVQRSLLLVLDNEYVILDISKTIIYAKCAQMAV